MSQTTLGERVTRILEEQRLRKAEFAQTLGITPNYVSQLAGGRKKQLSYPLAKLIENTCGYRAGWILTGTEPVYSPDTLHGLQENTIDKIMRMDSGGLRAVAAYIKTLDEVLDETIPAQTDEPVSPGDSGEPFSGLLHTLTPAERKVYDLFMEGYNARQTSDALELSMNTIKTHVRHIYKKLGVRSREELIGGKE
jgi:DNA-binding CsgD family transcriptional regulator